MRGNGFDTVPRYFPQSFQIAVAQKLDCVAIRSARHYLSSAEPDAWADALRDRPPAAPGGVKQPYAMPLHLRAGGRLEIGYSYPRQRSGAGPVSALLARPR